MLQNCTFISSYNIVQVVKVGPGEGGDMTFEVAFDDDLSDLLSWDALHASLARGVNSHGKQSALVQFQAMHVFALVCSSKVTESVTIAFRLYGACLFDICSQTDSWVLCAAQAADAPEMSSTPPPKSPELLPSGFRRFRDILPGNSLRLGNMPNQRVGSSTSFVNAPHTSLLP